MGGCGNGERGALIVCINMRELCHSSGESNTTSQCIKKRSDGIDTVYVGQGSNPPSPPSEQRCPGSLFTLLCSLLFFFLPQQHEQSDSVKSKTSLALQVIYR